MFFFICKYIENENEEKDYSKIEVYMCFFKIFGRFGKRL